MMLNDLPVLSVKTPSEWRMWLEAQGKSSNGVWLTLYKKASGITSITHAEALEEALCFGWIDGQSKGNDELSWFQKFTPRRSKSLWSKRNIEITDRLIKAGKMTSAGLKEIETAKSDGRWDRAYDSPKNMVIPKDFTEELVKNKKAESFFKTLNKTNIYAITWRLQTAKKTETRAKRLKQILEMLEKNEKFH